MSLGLKLSSFLRFSSSARCRSCSRACTFFWYSACRATNDDTDTCAGAGAASPSPLRARVAAEEAAISWGEKGHSLAVTSATRCACFSRCRCACSYRRWPGGAVGHGDGARAAAAAAGPFVVAAGTSFPCSPSAPTTSMNAVAEAAAAAASCCALCVIVGFPVASAASACACSRLAASSLAARLYMHWRQP